MQMITFKQLQWGFDLFFASSPVRKPATNVTLFPEIIPFNTLTSTDA